MKMYINQSRDCITAFSVNNLSAVEQIMLKNSIFNSNCSWFKCLIFCKYFYIFNNHNALHSPYPVPPPSRSDYASTFEYAAASQITVTSGCICKIDAGTDGVTGPLNALFTISALSSPLTTTTIFFALIIVPIPIV